jgi:hypothetical protein
MCRCVYVCKYLRGVLHSTIALRAKTLNNLTEIEKHHLTFEPKHKHVNT